MYTIEPMKECIRRDNVSSFNCAIYEREIANRHIYLNNINTGHEKLRISFMYVSIKSLDNAHLEVKHCDNSKL